MINGIQKAEKNAVLWNQLQKDYVGYLAGDAQITGSLFTEISKILMPFFKLRVRSSETSEDLVQVTLLKIHFARDRYDAQAGSLKTWVFTIANRCLIDHWRGSKEEISHNDQLLEGDALSGVPSAELDMALKFEFNKDLNQALNLLKPNDRSIVYLYAVEGFSMAEIADLLGLTEAAVKVRAHRSYIELRKQLTLLSILIVLMKGF
jgi:RNA polymerase sigma-70 factor, ECF subfamily